ncbi:MAG: HpcH/HpaI aldolase/citrate lyase family protein [Candidatus Heimdallarchaeota archaeon]
MVTEKKITKLENQRLRRTRLYIPGNNPAMIQNAMIYQADSLIFDLEDSIPIAEKASARILVRNAIQTLDFEGCEVTVRINSLDTEFYDDDLKAIAHKKLDGILLPKTETLDDILYTDNLLTVLEEEKKIPKNKIKLMPIIESAVGVLNIDQIATGPRVVAIGLGGEDLTADIGAKRTKEGKELEYIASRIIIACAANKIQAIDTVYADVLDPEGLYEIALKASNIGFQGKSVIHPSQIEPVHRAFMPSKEEITKAKRIVKAYKDAIKKGSGAFTVDGRMVDLPIVIRSERILKRAQGNKKTN